MMRLLLFLILFNSTFVSAQEDSLVVWIPQHFVAWDCDMSTQDGFHVHLNQELDDYHLTLFNRWGEVMFETNDQEAYWEPKDENGKYLPEAMYVWQITYTKSTDLDVDGVLETTEEKMTGHSYCLN